MLFWLSGIVLGWHLRKWAVLVNVKLTSIESGVQTEPLDVEPFWTMSTRELRERCQKVGIYRRGAVKDVMVKDLLEQAMQF